MGAGRTTTAPNARHEARPECHSGCARLHPASYRAPTADPAICCATHHPQPHEFAWMGEEETVIRQHTFPSLFPETAHATPTPTPGAGCQICIPRLAVAARPCSTFSSVRRSHACPARGIAPVRALETRDGVGRNQCRPLMVHKSAAHQLTPKSPCDSTTHISQFPKPPAQPNDDNVSRKAAHH